MTRFLGILREPMHSPNRESDDAKILKAVAEELSRHGLDALVLDVEPAFEAMKQVAFDLVVPMCEAAPTLARLQALPQPGMFVNPPQSVLNCYRVRMVSLLGGCPEARFPRTVVEPVGRQPRAPAFMNGEGVWVKRGDVHNTCDHDVVRAPDMAALENIRADFESRGIREMVLQEHLEGDLIKFYGVGPGKWYTWFYHDASTAKKHPFDPERLDEQASAAAAAVGLEVYGGDAIIARDGSISLIDINSWPSFARVRNEASVQIARHLLDKVKGRSGAPAATARKEAR